MTKTVKSVRNVLCPDNSRRVFYVSATRKGVPRGFVQVGRVSVTGYVKRRGLGYRFFPLFNGKNLHLVRPATVALNAQVIVTAPDSPYKGKQGKVCGLTWNYLTPVYSIQLDDRRFKFPVNVTGTDSVAITSK